MKNIKLNVGHVWQLDPKLGIADDEERYRVCALAAMKSVIEYMLPKTAGSLKLDKLKAAMINRDGLTDDGEWKHIAQVEVLKEDFGLIAWRWKWGGEREIERFASVEGYNDQQMTEVKRQYHEEEKLSNINDQVRLSMLSSFQSGAPVIVSVKAGFGANKSGHQIVLNGYRKDSRDEYFYFVDPLASWLEHNQNQKVNFDYFFKYFNYRAIFVLE